MKKFLCILACVVVFLALGLVVFMIPTRKIKLKSASSGIDRIYVFSGTKGVGFDVTDAGEIERIVDSIKNPEYKLHFSFWKTGYSFRLTFYEGEKEVYSCIMNSSGMIRKFPFDYEDKENSLCFDYISKLMEEKTEKK